MYVFFILQTNTLHKPKFAKLFERINREINSQKKPKEKKAEETDIENEVSCIDNIKSSSKSKDRYFENKSFSKHGEFKNVVHPKHDACTIKCTGREGMPTFQEVDFPCYRTKSSQISVTVSSVNFVESVQKR